MKNILDLCNLHHKHIKGSQIKNAFQDMYQIFKDRNSIKFIGKYTFFIGTDISLSQLLNIDTATFQRRINTLKDKGYLLRVTTQHKKTTRIGQEISNGSSSAFFLFPVKKEINPVITSNIKKVSKSILLNKLLHEKTRRMNDMDLIAKTFISKDYVDKKYLKNMYQNIDNCIVNLNANKKHKKYKIDYK